MAAPKRNRMKSDDCLHEKTRELAQTTQLVKRLRQYALNQKDDMGQEVKLETGRIRAIEILLNKTVPNLTSTTFEGKIDATLTLEKLSEDELTARIAELTED